MFATRSILLGLLGILVAFNGCVLLENADKATPDTTSLKETAPLPRAPEGLRIRQVAGFESSDQEPVRIAAHPKTGMLYVLGGGGDVTLLDVAGGKKRRVLSGNDYIVEQPRRDDVNIPLPIDAKFVNSPITLR